METKLAEEYLLGSILNNTESLLDVIGKINSNDFSNSDNGIIFQAIENLYRDNKKIDIVTLASKLTDLDQFKSVGGITYLSQLQTSVINSKNVKEYAEIIKENSNKRKLILLSKEIEKKATSDVVSSDIVNFAEEKMFSIVINNSKDRMSCISNVVDNTLQSMEDMYKLGGDIIGISTGFSDVDRVISGLQKQDYIIIAARPSMGKTTFAINIAQNVADKEKNVAIFSLEMSKEQLVKKMISAKSLIDYEKIKTSKLNSNEWAKVAMVSSQIASEKIFLDDTAGISVNEVKAKAKKIKLQHGLDVIVIDYLQLMQGNGEKNREQEISNISRGLKNIAKELNVTVIALSQLSRAPEQRSNHRPILSDLRESGSIEQDADLICFLYRDEYYNAETEDRNVAECIIGKQRNGQVGTIKLAWLGQYQRFANLDVTHR